MHRPLGSFGLTLFVFALVGSSLAQSNSPAATTTCNFDPDNQLAVEYQRVQFPPKTKVLGNSVPYGQVWTPGGTPMKLFINTPVTLGSSQLPMGAYTLFVIPEQKKWTLIVSKSTDISGKYDESHDLARVDMQFGKLAHPEPEFTAYFAHVAAKQCNLRLDLNTARAWVDFQKK